MKESILYKKLASNRVQCATCPHRCIIENHKRGKCGVKENKGGKLYNLSYGKIARLDIHPIEKNLLFHFMPGTYTLSLGVPGSNFSCEYGLNWQFSQKPKITGEIEGQEMTPEKIIELAIRYRVPSITFDYTEPTVFSEFAVAVMKLAKQKGIKTCWISNGFTSRETLKLVSPFIDAAGIEIKSFSDKVYQYYFDGKLKPVLDTLKYFKQRNIWLEITTLIDPEITTDVDVGQIAKFIKQYLGEETPWHISRFFPEVKWIKRGLDPEIEKLAQQASDIGSAERLRYVYSAHNEGENSENTYCPTCRELLIERSKEFINRFDRRGKCLNCSSILDIIE